MFQFDAYGHFWFLSYLKLIYTQKCWFFYDVQWVYFTKEYLFTLNVDIVFSEGQWIIYQHILTEW